MKKIKNDVYSKSNNIYLENGTLIMVSSFIVWASIGLLFLFPLFGAGLGYFAMCFLCLGFKKIVLDLIDKNSAKIENVFGYFKDCLSAFCLKVATTVIVLLWSLLFIVPGIVMGLNFIFAPYVLAEDRKIGAIKAMQKSKKLVYGNRGNIFVLYLTMALVTVLVHLFASFLIIVLNLAINVPLWIDIVVPMVVTMFVFFVYILPYFEIVFACMYKSIKDESKPKTAKKQALQKPKVEEQA